MTKEIEIPKRKKDFKLREDIVAEFERYAPSGKQTAIVEQLLAQWVQEQKRRECQLAVEKAYSRELGIGQGEDHEAAASDSL